MSEQAAWEAFFKVKLERDSMRAALEACEGPLQYAHEAFNAPNFTDRHGMGPKFTEALQSVRAALARTE